MSVRAVVCDLDGVLRHWPQAEQARIEHDHGLAPGAVLAALTRPELLENAVTGRTTDAQWRALAARDLAARTGRPITETTAAVAAWSQGVGVLDPGVLDTLRRWRRVGVPVVVLTNATDRLDADLAALGLREDVDAVVNSSSMGCAKPSAGAYEQAHTVVERLTGGPVERADVLFLDDTAGHVDAARVHGWTAVVIGMAADKPEPPVPTDAAPGPVFPGGATQVVRGRAAPADVQRILSALPGWFGIASATREYVEDARTLDAVTARIDDTVIGVVLWARRQPHAAELTLAAVDPGHHGRGVGRATVAQAEAWLREDGVRLVQVRTLGASRPSSEYEITRRIWLALGYEPLEEMDGVWAENPCLVMVKDLRLT